MMHASLIVRIAYQKQPPSAFVFVQTYTRVGSKVVTRRREDYIGPAFVTFCTRGNAMRRRTFLRKLLTTASTSAVCGLATQRAFGANDRIRVGVIGCGARGRYVAERMASVKNVEVVAGCDVYELKFGRLHAVLGSRCEMVSDFRKIIDRADIDAVLVATPDHWHAIPTVMACRAGKDVYVEKPIAHNIAEGRAIVTAARHQSRIVQTGLQQRSTAHFETMRQLISDGRIGNVRYVRVWNFRNTTPKRRKASVARPPGLDWDMFLGPAPDREFDYNRYQNFRRYWDYAGGLATNFGTHRFDTVRHVMSLGWKSPKTVSGTGRRFEVHDGGEDPDMVQMTFEYDDFVMSYEGSMMNAMGVGFRTPDRPYYRMLGQRDRPNGMAFYGTDGTIFADRLGFELFPELKPGERTDRMKPEEVSPQQFRTAAVDGRSDESTLQHAQNFFDCVRSRSKPIAEAAEGHASSIIPHLGNIAVRTGHKLIWNSETEEIENSPDASKLLGRDARTPWDIL